VKSALAVAVVLPRLEPEPAGAEAVILAEAKHCRCPFGPPRTALSAGNSVRGGAEWTAS